MTHFRSLAALALMLVAAPAQALVNRAWVSGHGTDAAGCGTPTSPCRSFQYVHDNIVAAGGEFDVLDGAGYGAITITKALSIVSEGAVAAVQQPNAGQNAITINAAAGDRIYLRGLTLDGLGVAKYGIHFCSGATLDIVNCVVRHFASTAIDILPSTASRFSVSDTLISDNHDGGIIVEFSTNVAVNSAIKNVTAINSGLNFYFSGAATRVSVVDSESSGAVSGFEVQSVVNGSVSLALYNVTARNNQVGVAVFETNGGAASVSLARTNIAHNNTGVSISSGTVYTLGENNFTFNFPDVSGALTPYAQK